jgi:hypothetical protein
LEIFCPNKAKHNKIVQAKKKKKDTANEDATGVEKFDPTGLENIYCKLV